MGDMVKQVNVTKMGGGKEAIKRNSIEIFSLLARVLGKKR
jgi:hypothetical protein